MSQQLGSDSNFSKPHRLCGDFVAEWFDCAITAAVSLPGSRVIGCYEETLLDVFRCLSDRRRIKKSKGQFGQMSRWPPLFRRNWHLRKTWAMRWWCGRSNMAVSPECGSQCVQQRLLLFGHGLHIQMTREMSILRNVFSCTEVDRLQPVSWRGGRDGSTRYRSALVTDHDIRGLGPLEDNAVFGQQRWRPHKRGSRARHAVQNARHRP